MVADAARDPSGWTFLTNHFHVLACLSRDAELRIRDVANLIGITERATVQIVSQLEASGYLTKTKSDAATTTPSTANFRYDTP